MAIHPKLQIARVIGETYDDPLGFVQLAYPWNEPGELAGFKGPDVWQRIFLEDLGREVRARGFDGLTLWRPSAWLLPAATVSASRRSSPGLSVG